ncbi:unnamed protein product [Arabis nemorensis]|uniref:Protein kinase domain-containing protein n=1 Tax=Arabis nemorensis TaxID=586526 RepID=A0A565BP17_9BRAS|nr:unnamed protein product [Arabis nemorensis]
MSPEMEFVKYLGKGTYGSVDLFRYNKGDGSTFYTAVKISDHKSFDREFQILSELKGCPRIVQVFGNSLIQGTDSNGKEVYKMPMEYAAAGNLTSFIKRNKNLSDSMIKDFTRMILQGLVSIHSLGYVHCDLKPDNLLLFPRYDEESWNCSYDLKISDFGLSIKAGEDSDCWEIDSPFVGTPVYMSPESVDDGSVEKTLDLWSLGCIVLEMHTGKTPWVGVSINDLQEFLAEGKNVPEIPNTVPCDARQFIETCFARKLEDRGTASELLLHPFLIRETKGMLLRRRRRTPAKVEELTKKPSKLKVITSKSPEFKKIANKPRRIKILPPRPPISSFVPV